MQSGSYRVIDDQIVGSIGEVEIFTLIGDEIDPQDPTEPVYVGGSEAFLMFIFVIFALSLIFLSLWKFYAKKRKKEQDLEEPSSLPQ